MRASIIIAAHNEGNRLGRTIASCVDSAAALYHEEAPASRQIPYA
jgi:hypothetical protein